MKKFKTFIFSALLVLCIAVCPLMFVACGNKTAKASVKNVLAMGMVSATNYLAEETNVKSAISDQTKETIKQYAKMFEGLLQNGLNPTESAPTEGDGEFATYAKKLEISADGMTYTMYYNEVEEGTTTEIDDEKIETETTSFIYGKVKTIMNNNVVIYDVVGTREIENENKKDIVESENELKLLFTTSALKVSGSETFDNIDLSKLENYVLIEQETEANEIEFAYTTKFGTIFKSVEIEFESKKGTIELEVEIEENNAKTKYKITKVSDNKYKISVKENKTNKTVLYLENNNDVWTFSENA